MGVPVRHDLDRLQPRCGDGGYGRSCFDGHETWLNTVERGREYVAGDLWGCVGTWFSGRWYTAASLDYTAAVQDYLTQRIWEREVFIGAT